MRFGMVPDPQRPEGKTRAGPATPAAPDRYCCANCEKPIATEHVIRIVAERGRGGANTVAMARSTGYMLITHVCPCSSLALTSRRYRSYNAFVALFGRGVNLPYESPFRPVVVADDDPAVRAWRWELEQTEDVEDFLYWLEHRRPT